MRVKISKLLSDEIQHKLMVLHDTEDLLNEYVVTKNEVHNLFLSVPRNGGEWEIPLHHMRMVMDECRDSADINHCMMLEAMKDGDYENAKVFGQIVKEFDELFKN